MAIVSPILVRATLPDISGVAADAVTNQFVFTSIDVAGAEAAVIDFYNGANTTEALAGYIGASRTRVANASVIQTYDIGPFMHGEPHGSPLTNDNWTLGAPSGNEMPDQVALVLGIHGDVSALPEHGATVPRPVSEEAIDQGAPGPTYLAKSRPRASLRGRLYIGPCTLASLSALGEVDAQFTTDATQALHRLRLSLGVGAWCVWSRTYGTTTPVIGGWIDLEYGVQRRRKDRTPSRTVWV